MTKQTIALIGSDRHLGSVLARKMAAKNQFRLLLVTEKEGRPDSVEGFLPETEAEFIDCLKDGCWEADIIVVDNPLPALAALAARIREVATQKIVLLVSEREKDGLTALDQGRLGQALLPNSKMVIGFVHADQREIFLSGDGDEAVQQMADLLEDLGYESIIQHKN